MLVLYTVVVSLAIFSASANRVVRSCGTCEPSLCDPLPVEGCKAGTVLDSCGCCSLCAAGEGEVCGGRGASVKRCASGLECVKNDKNKKTKLGVCACKTNYEVCGSDGVTYKTGCDLKAASAKAVEEEKPEINVLNKGKCATAPVIVTAPGEVYNVTGSQVFLSCEAIGIPTPVVTWKKISSSKKTELLPGDRDNLAIQTRGGPEKHEVTGWVLISPLTKEEEGSYECHAINAKGEASAMGVIHVVESIDDIPVKKVTKDDEL
ncbi:insulin-like growth factor-binding protein 7 isoform X2 [Hypomesus transpacificus]|uniref:insulin-like growth factor-binding protein 7 isoform X2 n=1 Tax=Hypomesus transpacificus TaxID=137520 RepID=UPI001F082F40|nr:insulin-like growth factor-binding protein 7 isoform X2 [Hypomesus transpacificus]